MRAADLVTPSPWAVALLVLSLASATGCTPVRRHAASGLFSGIYMPAFVRADDIQWLKFERERCAPYGDVQLHARVQEPAGAYEWIVFEVVEGEPHGFVPDWPPSIAIVEGVVSDAAVIVPCEHDVTWALVHRTGGPPQTTTRAWVRATFVNSRGLVLPGAQTLETQNAAGYVPRYPCLLPLSSPWRRSVQRLAFQLGIPRIVICGYP